MVKDMPNIEPIPPGPDEVRVINLTKGTAEIYENGCIRITSANLKLASIEASKLSPLEVDGHVKKSDMKSHAVHSSQITDAGALTVVSLSGQTATLSVILERLIHLETHSSTTAAGTGQTERITQLETENRNLLQRVKELEEIMKDIPTSRPAW